MKLLRILSFAVLILGVTQANAQFVKFGIKAGANFPSLNEQGGLNYTYNSLSGWHAGAALQFNVPIVKVGGEILYSANQGVNTSNQNTLKTSHITLPLFAKLSILKVIQIHTGPQFAFFMDAEEGGNSIKEQWNNKTFNWHAGAGVVLGPVDIHARFLFPQKVTIGSALNEFKNSNVQLSIIWFVNHKSS